MPPTQMELLKAAQTVDNTIHAHRVKVNKAILDAGSLPAATPVPVSELQLVHEDDDPFNGNINNRKVAERVAATNRRIWMNNSEPTHMGDPAKAKADIERSKRINPDPVKASDNDPLPPIDLGNTPTPGSPAAVKGTKGNSAPPAPKEQTPAPTAPTWTPPTTA